MLSKICVIGTGYVGLTTGTCFADLGNQVTCVDVIPEKVAMLRRGETPIYEPGLEEMLQRNLKAGRIRFTLDYAEGVPDADFVFIAVGTPEGPDGRTDMRYVHQAAASIGPHLRGHTVVVNKSTVPIGTGGDVHQIIARNTTNGATYAVASNPEFLREGQAIFDFFNPDRIVIGSTDRPAADKVATLYEPLNARVVITDLPTAEMIKYASNSMLAARISFMNEVAMICDLLGADVRSVALGMGADKRIGPDFLNAGIGFGGSCFPKDVKSLAMVAKDAKVPGGMLDSILLVNQNMRSWFVQKVTRMLGGDLRGKVVAVWGLAFKPNTDDMREAPSLDIIAALQAAGAEVRAYDPIAMELASKLLPGLKLCSDAYEAASGADAVLLVTEWNEFKQLDMARLKQTMRQPLIVDGRNLYDPADVRAAGFTYSSVGRQ